MNRDDIIRMAQAAGFGTLLTGNGLPTMWHGQDLCMLEKFAAMVAAEERQSIADLIAEIRRSIRIVSAVHYATKEVIGEVEIAVLKRGM